MKSFLRRFVGLGMALVLGGSSLAWASDLLPKPDDPFFAPYAPIQGPSAHGLFLRPGDRLAICGDSITEQRRYSRIMETYLTVCVPQLKVKVRQYGWSGETAEGFLRRMTNDCLRFDPTIATTCYGMNDQRYRAYDPANGRWYRNNQTAIVESFKSHGVRVVLGAAGCVGPRVPWTKASSLVMNENLCKLRNIDVHIAEKEHVRFADVFWPLLTASWRAQQEYGTNYILTGPDSVHPRWAGHLVMAYVFLKALGLNGQIGTFTVDFHDASATVSAGHKLLDIARKGNALTLKIQSDRYPFCATGPVNNIDSIRSGMTLVPFNQDLNRLMLVVRDAPAGRYRITWGPTSRTYTSTQLARGVNLAADFAVNPFSAAFKRVDEAVAAKQAYETRQIKQLFHGPEGRVDMPLTERLTEEARRPLVKAVAAAFVPVTHEIRITAE